LRIFASAGDAKMSLESLIRTYGYLAVLVGTFLEGETVLVLAGFAARLGYMKLPGVILAAFVGSLSGDQLFFYIGRRHGQAFLEKRPHWQARARRVHKLLEKHGTPFMIGFRFLYGLRTVSPFVIGTSSVPAGFFLLLNSIGAIIWAAAVGTGGYLFGHALQAIIGDLKRYEQGALAAIVIIGLSVWIIHLCRHRLFRGNQAGSS
jgi:membrane protein DedA with SNARE-associated domain